MAPDILLSGRNFTAPLMHRAANVLPSTYRAEDNSIEIVWTTGSKGLRFDWYDGTFYDERLSVLALLTSKTAENRHFRPVRTRPGGPFFCSVYAHRGTWKAAENRQWSNRPGRAVTHGVTHE